MWSISIQRGTVLNYSGFTIIIIITAVSFLCQYFRVIFSRPVSCEKTRKIILFHHCMSLNAISLFSFVNFPLSFVPANFQTRPCRQVMDCKSLWVISGVAGNLEYARWDPGLPNEPLQTHICTETQIHLLLIQQTKCPITQLCLNKALSKIPLSTPVSLCIHT